ncbi:HTH domain-containing protein [Streptomyces microflavus]|uniref:helix-turn-helix domain-containing protein n=1 Tax=Streptomyces microflavus TaxID=1919 RepID=UPI0033A80962
MIPAGRTGLGTADVAKRMHRKMLPPEVRQALPAPISREGARTAIWDAGQIDAYLAGQKIPDLSFGGPSPDELVTADQARRELEGSVSSADFERYVREGSIPGPDKVIDGVPHWKRSTVLAADDLLDRDEARLELRNPITPASWGGYIHQGRVPDPDVTVAGVPHWKRLTIRDWDVNRPGPGAGAGRPKGVKETKPRDTANNAKRKARQEFLQALLAKDEATSQAVSEFAEREGISERTVWRMISDLRETGS